MANDVGLAGGVEPPLRTYGDHIRVITATVTIYPDDPNLSTWVYSGLALDKDHQINGAFDSIETQFSLRPTAWARRAPFPS